MRCQSIYDRPGNNYRFARQKKHEEEQKERRAQAKRWDDIYQKAVSSSEKAYKND